MPAAPLLAVIVALQAPTDPGSGHLAPPRAPTATTVVARRATHPVVIDGKDDDAVWREAPPITAFREFSPREDGDPRFPTEAKVAYDDHNFYVFIRAFDPHPDSILKILARVSLRVATQFSTTLGLSVTHNVDDAQPLGPATDSGGVTHYRLAHLNQETLSLTGRVDYTITPDLTLQVYVQPFVSKGTYTSPRELADPGATAYRDRFKPYAGVVPAGFNFKEFNSNVVLRWEYRPGSTLFVVWTQGRDDFAAALGPRSLAGDVRDLFDLHPNNTFLVKASYWLNR